MGQWTYPRRNRPIYSGETQDYREPPGKALGEPQRFWSFLELKSTFPTPIFDRKTRFLEVKSRFPPPLLKLWSEYIIFVNHNNPWDYRTLFECSKFSRKWFISNEKIDFSNKDFQFLVGNDWFFGSKNDPCLDNFDQNKNWKNFTQIFFS